MAHQRLMLRAYLILGSTTTLVHPTEENLLLNIKHNLPLKTFVLIRFFFGHYIIDLRFPHQTNH